MSARREIRRQIEKRILSMQERETILRRLKNNESRLRGEIFVPGNRATGQERMSSRRQGRWAQFMNRDVQEDKGLIRRQIQRDQQILERGSPVKLNKRQQVALEKRAMAQKEWLQKRMCPQSLYYVKNSDPNFARATQACLKEHSNEFKKAASDYKTMMRQLDPDSPSASNLETIRPKT